MNMQSSGDTGLHPTAVTASSGAEQIQSPTVLMLVGMPGSGKSFFAGALCDESKLAWVRVNQDSVRSGNPGTRKQCIAAMKQAMTLGSNVVVDRTNFDASQRTDFIALAHQLGSQVHVIMLKLPLQLCVERVTGRRNHEGGVQGGDGARVVQRTSGLLNRAGLPSTSEGIASVTVCETVASVERMLRAWVAWSPGKPIPVQARPNSLAAAWGRASPSQHQQPPGLIGGGEGPSAALTHNQIQLDAISRRFQGGGSLQQPAPAEIAAAYSQVSAKQTTAAASGINSAVAVMPPVEVAKKVPTSRANAFSVLMQSAKQQTKPPPGSPPPGRMSGSPAAVVRAVVTRAAGAWSGALRDVARNPAGYRGTYPDLFVSDDCVRFADAYPKSRHHALVVARDPRLDNPSDLCADDVPLLKHMQAVGEQWIQQELEKDAGAVFKMGFHSIPSMHQLHLHVISQDFMSDRMKQKKHWNSFTTPFFLEIAAVIDELSNGNSRLKINFEQAERWEKADLQCNKCKVVQRNMPQLKKHILDCRT